jgi:hypothetical protein
MLTARDPSCLYAHWDFSAEQQKQYRELSESLSLELKVYRNIVGGPLISEEPVRTESNHSFVRVDASAGRYVAELGYYPTGGAWKAIATSEPASTPMEVIAAEEPVRFATLTFKQERPVEPGIHETRAQPTELPSSPPSPVEEIAPEFPLPRTWRGAAAGPVESMAEEELILPVLIKAEETAEKQSSRSEGESKPGLAGSETMIEERWMIPAPVPGQNWTEEQKQELEELSGWSSSRRRQIGSEEIEELIRARARKLKQLGLGAEALGEEISISSLGVVGELPEELRGFWFSVNAELVIYGATEPDAAVTIAGRRIRLRPDGTFSYRFSLPDGSYQLPIEARSIHGEERTAELSFYRGTRYGGEVNALVREPELKPPAAENVG